MPTEFENSEDLHIVGFYLGTVVDNKDPEKLGRIRLKVPGLVEPSSAWAFPFGTLAGGAKGRGWFDVPDVNADVCVLFYQGDVDRPFYVPGHWGFPPSGRETPFDEAGMSATDRLAVRGYETPRYQLVFDERTGKERVVILDKVNGNLVEVSDSNGITIKATESRKVVVDAGGDVEVKAGGKVAIGANGGDVDVDGSAINLNGPGPGVARLADSVVVTVPPGTFHITNPLPGPPTIPNPIPVPLSGVITSSSGKVTSG